MSCKEIAVLTPYSAQKEEIKKQIRPKQSLNGIVIKTITESQGVQNCNIIIILLPCMVKSLSTHCLN